MKIDQLSRGQSQVRFMWQVRDTLIDAAQRKFAVDSAVLQQRVNEENKALVDATMDVQRRINETFNHRADPADPKLMRAIAEFSAELGIKIDVRLTDPPVATNEPASDIPYHPV